MSNSFIDDGPASNMDELTYNILKSKFSKDCSNDVTPSVIFAIVFLNRSSNVSASSNAT